MLDAVRNASQCKVGCVEPLRFTKTKQQFDILWIGAGNPPWLKTLVALTFLDQICWCCTISEKYDVAIFFFLQYILQY